MKNVKSLRILSFALVALLRELKIFSYEYQEVVVPRVTNLSASSITHEGVSLTWTAPVDAIQGYSIQRNDIEIAQLNNTATSFNDYGLWPEAQFTYSVKTILTCGAISTIGVDVMVTTLFAPTYKKGYSYAGNTSLVSIYEDKPSYYSYGSWGSLTQTEDSIKHKFGGFSCKLAFTSNNNSGIKILLYQGPKDIQTAVTDKKAALSLWGVSNSSR